MTSPDLDDLEAFVDETMPALNLRGQTRRMLFALLSDLVASSDRLDPLKPSDQTALLEALTTRLLARNASGTAP